MNYLKKLCAILILTPIYVHTYAGDTAAVRKNIVKVNLLTPLNLDPTYEISFERVIKAQFSFEVALGIIRGIGLNKLDEGLFKPANYEEGIARGYRLVLSPKMYFRSPLRNSNLGYIHLR